MIERFIHTTLIMMSPILLAALGGLFTDLSGMLNIGLEGMLLISAFFSIYVTSITQSIFIGLLAGIAAAMLLGFLMSYFNLNLDANVFVVGLATNLFAGGFAVFLMTNLLGTKGTVTFSQIPQTSSLTIPFIEHIPVLNTLFSGYNIFVYLSILAVIITFIVIFKTPYGYHLRSVGEDENAASSIGISVYKHRLTAFLVSGFLAGLGGAALSLPLKSFVGGMSNGRGWIALVAVVLGRGNPVGVFLASFLFGAATAFSNIFQVTTDMPSKLLLAIPYVVTLVILIFYSIGEETGAQDY